MVVVGRVRDGALEAPVDELQVGLDERHVRRRLGADRAQGSEADGQVADPGRVALEDVEGRARRAVAAEEVARDRCREQGAARDLDLVRAARRREDPEVDLGRAVGRARGAADDGDLVDEDVAAAERGAEGVGADREDEDEDRHRDPRPLASVQALEDEVVHRPDQQDVGAEQGDEAADRRQGDLRQLGDRGEELAVVAEQATRRCPDGQDTAPQVLIADPSASVGEVGSNPMIVTAPLPYARSAAITRSPLVASARPSPRARRRGPGGRPCPQGRRRAAT